MTDGNNLGRVTVTKVHDITLSRQPQQDDHQPRPGHLRQHLQKRWQHPRQRSNLTLSVSNPGTTGWTVQYNVNGGTNYATPAEALQNHNGGVYAPGDSVTLNAVVTAPTGLTKG